MDTSGCCDPCRGPGCVTCLLSVEHACRQLMSTQQLSFELRFLTSSLAYIFHGSTRLHHVCEEASSKQHALCCLCNFLKATSCTDGAAKVPKLTQYFHRQHMAAHYVICPMLSSLHSKAPQQVTLLCFKSNSVPLRSSLQLLLRLSLPDEPLGSRTVIQPAELMNIHNVS